MKVFIGLNQEMSNCFYPGFVVVSLFWIHWWMNLFFSLLVKDEISWELPCDFFWFWIYLSLLWFVLICISRSGFAAPDSEGLTPFQLIQILLSISEPWPDLRRLSEFWSKFIRFFIYCCKVWVFAPDLEAKPSFRLWVEFVFFVFPWWTGFKICSSVFHLLEIASLDPVMMSCKSILLRKPCFLEY